MKACACVRMIKPPRFRTVAGETCRPPTGPPDCRHDWRQAVLAGPSNALALRTAVGKTCRPPTGPPDDKPADSHGSVGLRVCMRERHTLGGARRRPGPKPETLNSAAAPPPRFAAPPLALCFHGGGRGGSAARPRHASARSAILRARDRTRTRFHGDREG